MRWLDSINSIDTNLSKVWETVKPGVVQSMVPFDQAHKQYETARHLPPPLYVLFVQATAYGQACGECGAGGEEGLWEQRLRPGRHWKHRLPRKAPGPCPEALR